MQNKRPPHFTIVRASGEWFLALWRTLREIFQKWLPGPAEGSPPNSLPVVLECCPWSLLGVLHCGAEGSCALACAPLWSWLLKECRYEYVWFEINQQGTLKALVASCPTQLSPLCPHWELPLSELISVTWNTLISWLVVDFTNSFFSLSNLRV